MVLFCCQPLMCWRVLRPCAAGPWVPSGSHIVTSMLPLCFFILAKSRTNATVLMKQGPVFRKCVEEHVDRISQGQKSETCAVKLHCIVLEDDKLANLSHKQTHTHVWECKPADLAMIVISIF